MTVRTGGVVFTLRGWLLSHPGTNGYISSWGAMLSGTTPDAA